MEQPTIAHVYAAIDALYHSQNIEGKEQASKWLDKFQQSVSQYIVFNSLFICKFNSLNVFVD